VRKWLIVVVAVLVLGGVTFGVNAYVRGRAETAERDDVVELAIGQTHEISLESNASTGFTWLAHYDDKILELVEERYEQPSASSGQPALGAAGAQIFVFKALAKGEITVTFEYMRPWESLPPEKTQEYTFSIR